jgi:hypothetical protein
VSDYRLEDQAIGVRSTVGAKDFSSSLCVQTSSEAHPASCPKGTGGPFSGGKVQLGNDADHSPPLSAEVMNVLELYFLSPQAPPWCVVGLLENIYKKCALQIRAHLCSLVLLRSRLPWSTMKLINEFPFRHLVRNKFSSF